MISFIGNRPVLQIGRHQVADYDTAWLDDALRRAALAADHEDFPFIADIRGGIEQYLETKCPLKLLQLEDLFERVRMMLIKIGWERIAEKLEPLAPPMTVSLVRAAMEAGNGFELAFFETLRAELTELRSAGAEEIHFTGLRESSLILRGAEKWNKQCEQLLTEIEGFLKAWHRDQPQNDRRLRLCVENEM
ncbi:hypothetical protein JIN84_10145 [Luteolibacter yonseiensis]|uniref:Uncharacterized protein n=1 Tax=Luteolibacter yonseiensis TaxID=1144680 RepID=A0A934R669_9BACT|nr:hypothetical protein [Luteolibacter yonseiensis]MBK1815980.1 hypothetical protein [Luteolibacter yonseiensis]